MARRDFERNRAEGGRLEGVFGSLLVRRFTVRQPEMYRVVRRVTEAKLTTLSEAALCELAQAAMDIEYQNLDGDFLEVGCGSGGAAIVLAHAKRRSRVLAIHDLFATPDAEDAVRQKLSEHRADERLNVELVPGPFEKTISGEEPLALIHLDCASYELMRLFLERLTPRLVSGGQIILDDYKTQEGCKRAVDEYFRGRSGFELVRKSRLHVIKA